MILVKHGREEQRRDIMSKKNLKSRKERIMKDWTWKARKMKWKLEEIARKKRTERIFG